MAEGFARHLAPGLIEPSSAGVFPAAIVQPETFQIMAERGTPLDPEMVPRNMLFVDGATVDILVNMSGTPAVRLLRNFQGREITWDVTDPIGMSTPVYRAVRDEIEKRVRGLIEELNSQIHTEEQK
jgi:arsenate reductase